MTPLGISCKYCTSVQYTNQKSARIIFYPGSYTVSEIFTGYFMDKKVKKGEEIILNTGKTITIYRN